MGTIHTPCSPSATIDSWGSVLFGNVQNMTTTNMLNAKTSNQPAYPEAFYVTVKHWETFETDKHNMEKGSKASISAPDRDKNSCHFPMVCLETGYPKKKISPLDIANIPISERTTIVLHSGFPGRGCEGFGGSSSQGPQDAG